MTTSVVGSRKPVGIDDGLLRAGRQTAAFDSDDPETLFRNYLRLVRRARSQQRVPEISLRREDVEAISEYLGVTSEHVLHRLATLMGSSRTQRSTMLAAFASGALLISLSGSASASQVAVGSEDTRVEVTAPPNTTVVTPDTASDTASDIDSVVEPPTGVITRDISEGLATETDIVTAPVVRSGTSRQRSTVVVGDVGADRTPVATTVVLAATPAPSDPGVVAPSRPVTNQGGSRGGTTASVPSPADDVSLVTPVVPVEVAVGDAVVPPAPVITTPAADDSVTPPATDDGVDDEIPQELPPVDEDTVAVGSPPVPPTVPPTVP